MTAPAGGGPVERYLDEMFDRLAGSGPAGRRMLAEAESHLLAAVEDGRARGLDAEAAERAAIDRFGPVTSVVRDIPAAGRDLRAALIRLLIATWLAAGMVMLWWGGSGVLTWLLGWPYTKLLIDTGKFGTNPDMCVRPWVPPQSTVDCLTQYRDYLYLVPGGGDRTTYPWIALLGALLLAAWLLLRRPAHVALRLGLAAAFGLTGPVLTVIGITGFFQQAQVWALSYTTTGLFATAIGVAAFRRARTTGAAVVRQ